MKSIMKDLPAKLAVVVIILFLAWLFDGMNGIVVMVEIVGGLVLMCLAIYAAVLGLAKTNDKWNNWLKQRNQK